MVLSWIYIDLILMVGHFLNILFLVLKYLNPTLMMVWGHWHWRVR